MNRLTGIAVAMGIALLAVFLYNRFSGKSIATLGAKAAA